MTIELDHSIVPSHHAVASAERLAGLLGVPWAPSGLGPFSPVYVSEGLTLDFIQTDEAFPIYHFCFRVTEAEFDSILQRIEASGIGYRSSVRGPVDGKVNTDHGGRLVYWNEPDGHQWEMLTVSYARQPKSTPGVEIKPLSAALLPDFLAYFEGEAFADNPKWRSCYCQFLYVDHAKVDWPTRTAEANRAAACERICTNRMQGYLAYRDGKPVGWCNAAPRTMLDAFVAEPVPDAERIGQITCFVVAKPHRRSGVARALLQAACDGLKAQGFAIAEATPLAEASSDAKAHYGPLAMYLAAGFAEHRRDADGTVVVRRSLS